MFLNSEAVDIVVHFPFWKPFSFWNQNTGFKEVQNPSLSATFLISIELLDPFLSTQASKENWKHSR